MRSEPRRRHPFDQRDRQTAQFRQFLPQRGIREAFKPRHRKPIQALTHSASVLHVFRWEFTLI